MRFHLRYRVHLLYPLRPSLTIILISFLPPMCGLARLRFLPYSARCLNEHSFHRSSLNLSQTWYISLETPSRNIVMKYRIGRQFFLSMGERPSRNVSKHALDTNWKQRANAFANIISVQIRTFYDRDDISRITTRTRYTIIKQQ